jgi:hypothetical protein
MLRLLRAALFLPQQTPNLLNLELRLLMLEIYQRFQYLYHFHSRQHLQQPN